MILRPYQEEARNAVIAALAGARSTLVEMATGLGKSVVFAHIADEWPGRVLIIAHRDELIRQAAETVHAITGKPVSVEMGRERADDELYGTKITVGSVQTLSRSNRRSRFHPDHFSLVVVDEGHHATAVTYQEVLDHFPSAKRLFVTATPKRADKVRLGDVCETVAYQYGIEPAIDDGWLVPVRQSIVKVEGLDFSKARTLAQDFNQSDLEAILTEEQPLHEMVASAHEIVGDRQTLWFCVSVAQARAMAGVLSRYAGSDNVRFLSGDTPNDERHEVVAAYKRARIQHLLNCALFLEGFDAPTASAIVMGRPTKSLALYTQVLGRGTRPLPGIVDGIAGPEERKEAIRLSEKPEMMVIDYAGNAGRHKIVQAADVLGGKYPPPVRDYTKAMLQEDAADETLEARARRAMSIEEALARGKAELELLEEQDQFRKTITAEVEYSSADVSPFVRQYTGRNGTRRADPEPCSDKQAGYICYLARQARTTWNFKTAKTLSKRQASGVIATLKARAGI